MACRVFFLFAQAAYLAKSGTHSFDFLVLIVGGSKQFAKKLGKFYFNMVQIGRSRAVCFAVIKGGIFHIIKSVL